MTALSQARGGTKLEGYAESTLPCASGQQQAIPKNSEYTQPPALSPLIFVPVVG